MQQHSSEYGTPAAPPLRKRLSAEVRINQILDAALQAFAADGFAATRIDDIAQRAGLSKGGIYTHFKSKDDIFEALLARSLAPTPVSGPAFTPDEPVTVELLVERIVDEMYENLADGQTILTLRLLLADGSRVRERVARWRHAMVEPHYRSIEALLRQGVAQGTLRDGIVAQAPWLLISPGVYAIVSQLIFDDITPERLQAQRRAHIAMLHELLDVHRV